MSLYNTGPTQLELRRAALLARGMTRREIAEVETVSIETVKSTIRRLRLKFVVNSSLQLVIELQRRKLLVWDRGREELIVNPSLFADE